MPGTGKKHRLTDIHTDEVSFVDRAANEKKFLTVKQDTNPMALGPPVQKNPDGSYSAGAAASGAPASPAAPPAAAPPVTKAGAALTQDAKDALAGVIAASTASLEDASALVAGAQIVASEGEMDTTAIVDAIMSATENAEDAIMAIVGAEQEDDAEKPTEVAASEGEPDLPLGKRLEISVLKRRLTMAKGVVNVAVEKAGAKMAKARINTLKNIMRALHKFVREIEPPRIAAPAAKAAPPAPIVDTQGMNALIEKAAKLEADVARLSVEKKALDAAPPATSTAGKPGEVSPVQKSAHKWAASLTASSPWQDDLPK